ncbi:MAG: hypothetical protein LBJ00_08265 [Planctomycetaceae bacterium]|nr:hypothetical protein [Planctomycetaceae bacterium]
MNRWLISVRFHASWGWLSLCSSPFKISEAVHVVLKLYRAGKAIGFAPEQR